METASSAILTYHSLDESGSVISLSPAAFARHVAILAEERVRVVPLEKAAMSPGAVAITFDDGFRNFLDGALPALIRHGMPATVFAVSEYCGKKNDWPSQPAGIPRLELMDWADLRQLQQYGVSTGCHSATHARLTGLNDRELPAEIDASRACIEDRIGAAVTAFAYPYGDSGERARCRVALQHTLACGTSLRYVDAGSDRFDLPRIDAYYLRNEWLLRNLFSQRGRSYLRARGWMRSARAAVAG